MKLEPVQSSNIKAIGHEGKSLFVQFQSGEVWEYTPIPVQVYEELIKARSIGAHFHKWIRSNSAYKSKKVEGPAASGPPSVA